MSRAPVLMSLTAARPEFQAPHPPGPSQLGPRAPTARAKAPYRVVAAYAGSTVEDTRVVTGAPLPQPRACASPPSPIARAPPPTQIRPCASTGPTMMRFLVPRASPLPEDLAFVEGGRWEVATANTARVQIPWILWGWAKPTQLRQVDFQESWD
jgi:hypothetical protein